MVKILSIALGGALGALTRYFVSGCAHNLIPGLFAWGTLAVNCIGSFLAGVFFGLLDRFIVPGNIRLFILIGLLGAFTTFSTYTLETFNLLRDGELKLALINIILNNLVGIFLVVVGFMLSKLILIFIR
ncbi:MAG: fluoride efflux transporter CrcB [Candidatus Gastranaerophilales bacterium]|nr:fluoride efflux transporter CrcB [Candidatus Gastranaerophilales bacterium]